MNAHLGLALGLRSGGRGEGVLEARGRWGRIDQQSGFNILGPFFRVEGKNYIAPTRIYGARNSSFFHIFATLLCESERATLPPPSSLLPPCLESRMRQEGRGKKVSFIAVRRCRFFHSWLQMLSLFVAEILKKDQKGFGSPKNLMAALSTPSNSFLGPLFSTIFPIFSYSEKKCPYSISAA